MLGKKWLLPLPLSKMSTYTYMSPVHLHFRHLGSALTQKQVIIGSASEQEDRRQFHTRVLSTQLSLQLWIGVKGSCPQRIFGKDQLTWVGYKSTQGSMLHSHAGEAWTPCLCDSTNMFTRNPQATGSGTMNASNLCSKEGLGICRPASLTSVWWGNNPSK